MKTIPVYYGKSVLPESMIFINGDPEKFRTIVFKIFLIKTGKKMILVDAGCETMPGFVMTDFIGSVKALENIGVSSKEITDVIITHSHHDHIECVKYFENAVIHIEKNEYDAGIKYIPDNFNVNVFTESFLLCPNIKIEIIGGHSKGSCVVEIDDNSNTYVIVGDECYSRDCINNMIPTGCSFDSDRSRKFIEKYSKNTYSLLYCHDE